MQILSRAPNKSIINRLIAVLNHSFQCTLSLPPEKRKPGREVPGRKVGRERRLRKRPLGPTGLTQGDKLNEVLLKKVKNDVKTSPRRSSEHLIRG